MIKNFDISKFKNNKPPSDNSLKTLSEIKQLLVKPINKKFVIDNDKVREGFKKIVDDKNIDKIADASEPIILKLKKFYNRPRPKELAENFGMKIETVELPSMKTPSYPSGHSAQAYLLSSYLSNKYPSKAKELNEKAKDISDSRNIARAHYKSDSEFGKQLGIEMSKHIKEQ
tara:strand:+ start:2068 stop:2583 length:516 start_codon:yes stop_codon:yes gene_type:complete